MKQFKIGLCFLDEEENIVVKKCLESSWTTRKDLKEFHSFYMKDEIASVLLETIKIGLTEKIIKEMLEELEKK